MRKAYRITTIAGEAHDFSIYSAESAGKAKTMAMYALKTVWSDATYSWITSCRRMRGWDNLARLYSGCIHWQMGKESWTRQFSGRDENEE